MERIRASPRNHGAKYSTFGIARTSRDRLGVPPCQQRASRKIAEPAGSGQIVLSRIHSGSAASLGIGARDRCVPGICLIGPFSGVRSTIGKLMCTDGTGRSRIVTPPTGSCNSDHTLSECSPWYSIAPGSARSPPQPYTM